MQKDYALTNLCQGLRDLGVIKIFSPKKSFLVLQIISFHSDGSYNDAQWEAPRGSPG